MSMGIEETADSLNMLAIEAIVRAVAEIEMPAVGPCEDLVCPFGCGWEEYAKEEHSKNCPVTLAKMLLK